MKFRNHVLALVGVAAFIVCVLACRPAFSPDGKKVVFPVFDPESKQATVMLYDRETRRLERLFTRPSQSDDFLLASAIWTPDGKHVVIATTEEMGFKATANSSKQLIPVESKDPFMVAVIPLDRKEPIRFLHVPENPGLQGLIQPPPIVGKHLFLGGASRMSRLDLETGEIKTETLTQLPGDKEDGILIFGGGERLYYIRVHEETSEIGTLDPVTLGTRAIIELRKSEAGRCNVFPAVSKDGSRIAVEVGDEKGQTKIRIYHESILERTLEVGTSDEPIRLGNLLWSSDEQFIYAAQFKNLGEGKTECGLYEIPINGGKPRSTALCVTKENGTAPVVFQIALSPDGKCVAASGGFSSGNTTEEENRALYLVDLRRAKRPVTKIPAIASKPVKSGTGIPKR